MADPFHDNDDDIATLADGTTLMAVIRIDGGDGKLPGAARPAPTILG